MKLEEKKAKELAKKYLLESGMKDGKIIYAHTEGVVFAAAELAGKYDRDKKMLEAVAWVHDIGQFEGTKDHAEISLSILEKEGIEIDDLTRDCILNHGNSGNPKSFEAKLINIADKISIIDRKILAEIIYLDEINEDYIGFIKMISEKAIEKLRELEGISEE
jgi:HD superfamily phosphodiesterase